MINLKRSTRFRAHKNMYLFLTLVLLWMWGCNSNSSGTPQRGIQQLSNSVEGARCQRILEGEDTIPMRGMVYDSQKNIVTGTIPGTAFRCSYGEMNLNESGGFRILGECGQAPGRIQSMVNEVSCGDGFVYVRDLSRIQVFDPDGGYAGVLLGIRPYQITFKVFKDRVVAVGINRINDFIVVTEYKIGTNNELALVRDIAVIRDWRNHIANSEVAPKEVVEPAIFKWIGDKLLFVGEPLWGQYILVNLSTGNCQYRNVYLSEKKAKTLPNRNAANYMCAFDLGGKIALVEPVRKAVHVNRREVELYYVVDIQEPLKGTTKTFTPLFTDCNNDVVAINAFDAVSVGPESFLAMEYVKKTGNSEFEARYTRYKVNLSALNK
jgi:hypothetical protein